MNRSVFTPIDYTAAGVVADLPGGDDLRSNAELEDVIRRTVPSPEAQAAGIILRGRQELLAEGLVPVYPDGRPFPGFEG
jgi:hypothetical protein